MKRNEPTRYVISPLARRIGFILALSAAVMLLGTVGYRMVSRGAASWLDSLYMTVITVLTIGYGEVVDMTANPVGRVFTMVIAFGGIAVVGYALSSLMAFAVGGDLRNEWRRWKMQKTLQSLDGHYILCGWSGVAAHVLEELRATKRSVVVVSLQTHPEEPGEDPGATWVTGDPCDEEVLRQVGIARAVGLCAAEDSDPVNIVICMTARQLNPALRIVALAADPRNEGKLRKAGADAVVSALRIGGLRMASEMVRPTAVSFLDIMLRDRERGLRIEEARVGRKGQGMRVGDLRGAEWADLLVLAIRDGTQWVFNPSPDVVLKSEQYVVVMCNAGARERLQQRLGD